MQKTIFLVALIIATSLSIFGQMLDTKSGKMSKTEQAVADLVGEFGTAIIKRDTAAMERLLADDFMEITLNGNMTSKSQYVTNYKSLFRRRLESWKHLSRATRKCVSMATRR
jgi:uncharacterized protein YdeI (BOF family)